MTPTKGLRSPRAREPFLHAIKNEGQTLHSAAHTGILADGKSEYLYPKVSVQGGRKAASVITLFQASGDVKESAKPHFYMSYQAKENSRDIQHPASRYHIGTVKNNNQDAKSTLVHLKSMNEESRRPKAMSIIKSPANDNAFHKKPIIRIDSGSLAGNMLTMVYTKKSPTSKQVTPPTQHVATRKSPSSNQEKGWLQLGLPHGGYSQGTHHAPELQQHNDPAQQASSESSRPRKTTLNLLGRVGEHQSRRADQIGPAKKNKKT